MRVLVLISVLFITFIGSAYSDETKQNAGELYLIVSNTHLIDDISYKEKEAYIAVIEVPAGTSAKWEVNHETGNLEWEFKNGKPRYVQFLGYPGNYGYIPQTKMDDGDSLDIIVLDSAVKSGTIQKVKVIGVLALKDKNIRDDKILAVPFAGPFAKIDGLCEMMVKFPGVIEIVKVWFQGYKGDKIQFVGYKKKKQAYKLIEAAHNKWALTK